MCFMVVLAIFFSIFKLACMEGSIGSYSCHLMHWHRHWHSHGLGPHTLRFTTVFLCDWGGAFRQAILL